MRLQRGQPRVTRVLISLQKVSSKRVKIQYSCPTFRENPFTFSMIRVHLAGDQQNIVFEQTLYGVEHFVDVRGLQSGAKYTVYVKCQDSRQWWHYSHYIGFTATFCITELSQLCGMAKRHQQEEGDDFRPIKYFYRSKPQGYYNKILGTKRQIMWPRLKDSNGDAANPLNRSLRGTFFSGRVLRNGDMETNSPFGDTKFFIQTEHLLSHEDHNIYFADYYCMFKVHYILLVITKCGRYPDIFCSNNLVPLNPFSNPFMRIDKDGNVFLNHSVRIELFFTYNVELELGEFTTSGLIGDKVQGQRNGITKNRDCDKCNLYRNRK